MTSLKKAAGNYDKILTFSYHCDILCHVNNSIEVIHISCTLSSEDYLKSSKFISRIKPLLNTGDFQIVLTEKNKLFDCKFPLTDQKKRDILRSLTADDCYQIEPNNNPRYQAAEVYKFLKNVDLLSYGEQVAVELYIKMYIKESKSYDMVIVISFHEEGMHDFS